MYEARSLSALPRIDPGGPPSWLAGLSKIDPSPTWSQPTIFGIGVHGLWLETVVISANTGACPGASSFRWTTE
jgi:hypothetical protein